MSKFDELLDHFEETRKEYEENRETCWDFTRMFLDGFRDYFDCPQDKIKLHEPEGHCYKKLRVGENKAYHFAVLFTLAKDMDYPIPEFAPLTQIDLEFTIIRLDQEKENPNFSLAFQVGETDGRFEVKFQEIKEREDIYSALLEGVKNKILTNFWEMKAPEEEEE
ncbi:hypothetical protein ACFL35_01445 [Candidatus Riflebacteria bacterium]